MAIKSEIAWRRTEPDGSKTEIYARRFGGAWTFYHRARRHDLWQSIDKPTAEDWLTLLEALERRVPRRLTKPEEVLRVRRTIRERHPGTVLPPP